MGTGWPPAPPAVGRIECLNGTCLRGACFPRGTRLKKNSPNIERLWPESSLPGVGLPWRLGRASPRQRPGKETPARLAASRAAWSSRSKPPRRGPGLGPGSEKGPVPTKPHPRPGWARGRSRSSAAGPRSCPVAPGPLLAAQAQGPVDGSLRPGRPSCGRLAAACAPWDRRRGRLLGAEPDEGAAARYAPSEPRPAGRQSPCPALGLCPLSAPGLDGAARSPALSLTSSASSRSLGLLGRALPLPWG